MKFTYSGSADGSGGLWPSAIHLHQLICKGGRGPSDRETSVTSRGLGEGKGAVSGPSSTTMETGSQQFWEGMEKAVCPLASVSHGRIARQCQAPGHKCMQVV